MSRRGPEARRQAWRAGRGAESLAAWLLRLKGYRILGRNLRTPVGEIDLLARRGDVLAVVEVKARNRHGDALEAVGPRQRRRIEAAAAALLARQPDRARLRVRFDVVVVVPGHLPAHLVEAWRPGEDQSGLNR